MDIFQYAVIGHPIRHTMSPFIQKRLFELNHKKFSCEVLDISPEDLQKSETLEKLKKLNGFNITIPHKQNIFPLLDFIEPTAKTFSSVNTVKVENGKLSGYTTDGEGFLKSLAVYNVSPSDKNLLLGSGGAAHVIAFELVKHSPQPDISICARDTSQNTAENLARALREQMKKEGKTGEIKVYSYETLANENFDLLVNATSLGMHPHIDSSPPLKLDLKQVKTVFDIVYNPTTTKLLKEAKEKDCLVIGGMSMLVEQAAAAQRIWYDAKFEMDDLKKLYHEAEKEMEILFNK